MSCSPLTLETVLLLSLHLAAVFDTVNHKINIIINACHRDHESSSTNLCGVPQASVLGSLSFAMNLLSLGSILRKQGVAFPCYADDMVIYTRLKRRHTPYQAGARRIKDTSSFLKINENKTMSKRWWCPLLSPGWTTITLSLWVLMSHLPGSICFKMQNDFNCHTSGKMLASLPWLPIHFKNLLCTFHGLVPDTSLAYNSSCALCQLTNCCSLNPSTGLKGQYVL